MIVQMTMEVTLILPDGSASLDGSNGRGWVLPNGDLVWRGSSMAFTQWKPPVH